MATAVSDTLDTASLQALLGPQLTAEQARLIYEQGPEAVVFALLTLAKQLAEQSATAAAARDPSAPSGQTPPVRQADTAGASQAQGRPTRAIPAIAGPRRRTSTAARSTP